MDSGQWSGVFAITLALTFAACAPRTGVDTATGTPLGADGYPASLDVVTRAEWNAKPPVIATKEHELIHITVHHTATNQNRQLSLEQKLRNLQAWSQRDDSLASGRKKPAWPDIPYHYYIDWAGRVGEGREVRWVGDTNTTYDPTGHVLIVLEGNFQTEEPTPEQLRALREMTAWAARRWNIPAAEVQGHRDYAQTSCPGEKLYDDLPALREMVAALRR